MQTQQELEDWYAKPDQWGYFTNPEDSKRRDLLLSMFDCGYYYQRALDVGCGEGFITQQIPFELRAHQEMMDIKRDSTHQSITDILVLIIKPKQKN